MKSREWERRQTTAMDGDDLSRGWNSLSDVAPPRKGPGGKKMNCRRD